MSIFDVGHLITTKEMETLTGIPEWSIREECKSGNLRASKRREKWYIEPEDARAWFEDGVPSAAERPEPKSTPAPAEYGSLRGLDAA